VFEAAVTVWLVPSKYFPLPFTAPPLAGTDDIGQTHKKNQNIVFINNLLICLLITNWILVLLHNIKVVSLCKLDIYTQWSQHHYTLLSSRCTTRE
jgi:hypothetical protein